MHRPNGHSLRTSDNRGIHGTETTRQYCNGIKKVWALEIDFTAMKEMNCSKK